MRLARLPSAVNGKQTPPFSCRLVEWAPELRYSVENLIDGLQVEMAPAGRPGRQCARPVQDRPRDGDPIWIGRPLENAVLAALRAYGLYKVPLGDGKHDITCPWSHEHTGGADGGTAYFEPEDAWPIGGFKCLHGHCADRHIRDLLRFLGIEVSAARMNHDWRTRLSLLMDAPIFRLVYPPDRGRVVAFPELGGLHHHYERLAA